MTKITLLLTLSIVFQLTPTMQAVIKPADAAPRSCYTFTVDNVTTDSLGDVTISGGGDHSDFNVTGYGQYPQELCFTAISATIAGTVVPYPNSANIHLSNGAWVTAGWQSPSLVEVMNDAKQDGPLE